MNELSIGAKLLFQSLALPWLVTLLTMSTQTEPLRREILVVTGASTGIDAATARELARRGFYDLAGMRRATNLEPIMLYITNDSNLKGPDGKSVRCFQGHG